MLTRSSTSYSAGAMRIGVDTGGTFTDIVILRNECVLTHKRLSTPEDPSRAVIEGIAHLLAGPASGDPHSVVHGSTIATNALLERRGARTALVTTEGFEDVLEIGRQNRPLLHNLEVHRTPPIVPTERRLGVRERVGPDGTEKEPLNERAVKKVVDELQETAPESVAIVLLHSYANPEHEARLARELRETLNVPVTVSHELLPEYREYERTSTCVINAYVAPKMSGYLVSLEASIPGGAPLRVMRSDGGTMTAGAAGKNAVHTVLSGPAGGVVGASAFAGKEESRTSSRGGTSSPSNHDTSLVKAISFDMGGTSTDVCLIDGRPAVTKNAELGGHPIRVPLLDIHTVGAGGGSIAWRDDGGALRVGPASAGSNPGPACYGLGGTRPSVTDANLVLGRLPSEQKLAGSMPLDVRAAREAVASLADTLGIDLFSCAKGIVRIANIVMMRAIRRISLERGYDPRRFALVSFGGAGGLHACDLAASLSMDEVLVPPHPGLLSAYGMLAAKPEREVGRSVLGVFPAGSIQVTRTSQPRHRLDALVKLDEVYKNMEKELAGELSDEGIHESSLRFERLADLRYLGQSHELTVKVNSPDEPGCAEGRAAMLADVIPSFEKSHELAFGYCPARDVEWVTARVRASAPPLQLSPPKAPAGDPVSFEGGSHHRESLTAQSRIIGPATILEYSATTYVPASWQALVLNDGTLRISK